MRRQGWAGRRAGCIWLIGGGLVGTAILGLLVFGLPLLASSAGASQVEPVMTVVVAPSETPTPTVPPPSPTPVPPTATPTPPPAPPGGFTIGELVEITGTGGDGLRLRSEPSLAGTTNDLAMDSEVFKVEQGPQEAEGYTWWFLVNPYDSARQGWGVANYLRPLQSP
jgi:hypothetical protein